MSKGTRWKSRCLVICCLDTQKRSRWPVLYMLQPGDMGQGGNDWCHVKHHSKMGKHGRCCQWMGFESCLCHITLLLPWASYLTFLRVSVFPLEGVLLFCCLKIFFIFKWLYIHRNYKDSTVVLCILTCFPSGYILHNYNTLSNKEIDIGTMCIILCHFITCVDPSNSPPQSRYRIIPSQKSLSCYPCIVTTATPTPIIPNLWLLLIPWNMDFKTLGPVLN